MTDDSIVIVADADTDRRLAASSRTSTRTLLAVSPSAPRLTAPASPQRTSTRS